MLNDRPSGIHAPCVTMRPGCAKVSCMTRRDQLPLSWLKWNTLVDCHFEMLAVCGGEVIGQTETEAAAAGQR